MPQAALQRWWIQPLQDHKGYVFKYQYFLTFLAFKNVYICYVGLGYYIYRIVIFLGLLGSANIYAQLPDVRIDIRRANNFTYSSRWDMDYNLQSPKYSLELNIHHDNLLNSTLNKSPFVQAYLHTSIWQYYQLNSKISLASWIEYDHFFNNQNYRLTGYTGLSYRPFSYLSVTPLIGYSWDYRASLLDQGLSPAIRLRSQYKWEDGLTMETYLFARSKDIEPRNQRNITFNSIWAKSFGSYADLAFRFHAGTSEIDDYRNRMIESIVSDTIQPGLNLRYQIQPNLYWDSENTLLLTNRSFRFDPLEDNPVSRNDLSFGQLNLGTQQKLSYATNRFNAFLTYEYQYLSRRYELENTLFLNPNQFEQLLNREKQKDFFRALTRWELQLSYRIHPQHNLRFAANNIYIKYDTPSEINFDDHDELTYGSNLAWNARWSRKFSTTYRLLGNIRQYAFLFQERSQDNYTQYSLRMEFDYRWEALDNLILQGSQDIYVTYNIKDFDDINRTDRSTRNLETDVRVNYRPSRKWETLTTMFRRETHVSYINWDSFTETTLDTTVTYNISHIHTLRLKSPWESVRLLLEIGYQHLSVVRKQNTAMSNLNNLLVPVNLKIRNFQSGPRTGIKVFHRNPATIDLSVWWQVQYQDNLFKEVENFSTLGATYREQDLTRINRFFRPFFELKLNFWLRG